ncbi:hypothetical protein P3S67_002742 [Capsicum chacoense]
MADWLELQHDLLLVIAKRINLIEDYLSFHTVCKSWHAVATKGNFNSDLPRVPWLMLAEVVDDDDRTCSKFFSLYNGMVLKKRIPGAVGKRCMESMGWLITVGKDEGEMSLLHPFSAVQIELPHQNTTESYALRRTFKPWTFISKAVLSANPCHTSDYFSWSLREDPITSVYGDQEICHGPGLWYYILESLGSLFVVARRASDIVPVKYDCERIPPRFITVDDEDAWFMYRTNDFIVFQIDLDAYKATPTRDLGDRAFFLGASASLSVQASQFTGIRFNHIYFTDTNWGACLYFEHGGGLDMGVFNLADGSIQPHYDGVSLGRFCPPIWVTPNPC